MSRMQTVSVALVFDMAEDLSTTRSLSVGFCQSCVRLLRSVCGTRFMSCTRLLNMCLHLSCRVEYLVTLSCRPTG